MEQWIRSVCRAFHSLPSSFFIVFSIILFINSPQTSEAYENYTVGDALGWFDNLMVPKVNYQSWAAGKNFSLGDYLLFNTDKNHSIIQTYNITIYRHCDNANADSVDTTEWSVGEPEFNADPITVVVPLLKEGPTYFFSGNYEGEQCEHGQHFKINVTHGQGLPDSLKSPSEQAPAPNSADFENDVPDTVIPSNFDNPKDDDDSNVKAESAAGETVVALLRKEGGMFILVVFVLNLVMVFV